MRGDTLDLKILDILLYVDDKLNIERMVILTSHSILLKKYSRSYYWYPSEFALQCILKKS